MENLIISREATLQSLSVIKRTSDDTRISLKLVTKKKNLSLSLLDIYPKLNNIIPSGNNH